MTLKTRRSRKWPKTRYQQFIRKRWLYILLIEHKGYYHSSLRTLTHRAQQSLLSFFGFYLVPISNFTQFANISTHITTSLEPSNSSRRNLGVFQDNCHYMSLMVSKSPIRRFDIYGWVLGVSGYRWHNGNNKILASVSARLQALIMAKGSVVVTYS